MIYAISILDKIDYVNYVVFYFSLRVFYDLNIFSCIITCLDMDKSDGKKFERYAFLPIKYPELEHYYKKQKLVFWTAEEVDYAGDIDEWLALHPNAKKYVTFILALFAQLDGLVNENLVENFKKDTSFCKECTMFYAVQEAVEWMHNETYSNLIKTYITSYEEQLRALNSIHNYPEIREIADWAFRWMKPEIPLTQRLIAFACIEGIIFSSAFAGIYWIKRMNILRGLTQANEWIARDENIHTEFPVALYLMITSGKMNDDLPDTIDPSPLDQAIVHNIISSAVDVTEKFTRGAMNTDLVNLSADDMVGYVKCTADHLAKSFGYDYIYDVVNPLPWMITISLPNKTNFFEHTVSEYSRQTESDFRFDLDAGF